MVRNTAPIEPAQAPSAAQRRYEAQVLPQHDAQGKLTGRLLTLRDITARTQADATQRFLAEASTLLASSLDYETTLTTVAQLAAPYFAENSMNVFRRFNGDGRKTLEFYGQVLGFGDVGAVGGVSRYQVGPSQLKFTRAGANAKFTRGGINDAAGVRLWTMWFPDEGALTKRFADGGLPAPAFKTIDGVRSALVSDPDGESVQLVVAPNASKETYGRLEIGIGRDLSERDVLRDSEVADDLCLAEDHPSLTTP